MFRVTTLDPSELAAAAAGAAAPPAEPSMSAADLAELESKIAAQGDAVRAVKEKKKEGAAEKADVDAAVAILLDLKSQLPDAEATAAPKAEMSASSTAELFAEDFFGKQAFLTVSGQLSAENYACALGDVYTFGPTFRAEDSNTARHLAEFWMIEPEMAFADLADDMACAEAYLKHCVASVLEHCAEDLEFFDKRIEKGLKDKLTKVVEAPFRRISYTEAVDTLQAAVENGHEFEFPVEWGSDLQSEHERYLSEVVCEGAPVIVYDYPAGIKAFYMRMNDDQKTVAAMDLLVPRVGELIGGSQREERLDVLEERLEAVGLDKEAYWWYLDLRRYGTVPHAGFGLGFERLVCFCTGIGACVRSRARAHPRPRAHPRTRFARSSHANRTRAHTHFRTAHTRASHAPCREHPRRHPLPALPWLGAVLGAARLMVKLSQATCLPSLVRAVRTDAGARARARGRPRARVCAALLSLRRRNGDGRRRGRLRHLLDRIRSASGVSASPPPPAHAESSRQRSRQRRATPCEPRHQLCRAAAGRLSAHRGTVCPRALLM